MEICGGWGGDKQPRKKQKYAVNLLKQEERKVSYRKSK